MLTLQKNRVYYSHSVLSSSLATIKRRGTVKTDQCLVGKSISSLKWFIGLVGERQRKINYVVKRTLHKVYSLGKVVNLTFDHLKF